MSQNEIRRPPSGEISELRGSLLIGTLALAASTVVTATATFSNANILSTDGPVLLSPRAGLGTGVIFSHARVAAAGILEVTLANVQTAATTSNAATFLGNVVRF